MHSALRAAIEQGEFFPLYQPLIAADRSRVVAFEALARWRRPGSGIIEPKAFVPAAEASGLIAPIGAQVMAKAMQDASSWPASVRLAVNVSPIQFSNPDFVALVRDTATTARLPLSRLELEITELSRFDDLDRARLMLAELRGMGVMVTLDDLAEGQATPQLMRDLPLDRVKLSARLTAGMVDLASESRLKSLISEALELGLGVTAEGVERQEQIAFLRACGCDLLQGFLFARPMRADEISAFISRI